jgi:glycosyltransferase involved in cell wall biosynthesis
MTEYSIVIPAHNESSRLERNVSLLDDFMQKLGSSYEIIIAEDGSSDKTYPIATELATQKCNVRVLHSKERLGKGAAITRAIEDSKGRIVAFMDADLAVDLENLPYLLKSVEENRGVVVGSRWVKGAKVRRSLLRNLASRTYNICAGFLFQDGVLDHQCGLKGFTRRVASEVLPKMKSTDWVWDTEFILLAIKAGYNVYEMPVSWQERKRGASFKTLELAPIMLFELLKLKIRFLK